MIDTPCYKALPDGPRAARCHALVSHARLALCARLPPPRCTILRRLTILLVEDEDVFFLGENPTLYLSVNIAENAAALDEALHLAAQVELAMAISVMHRVPAARA